MWKTCSLVVFRSNFTTMEYTISAKTNPFIFQLFGSKSKNLTPATLTSVLLTISEKDVAPLKTYLQASYSSQSEVFLQCGIAAAVVRAGKSYGRIAGALSAHLKRKPPVVMAEKYSKWSDELAKLESTLKSAALLRSIPPYQIRLTNAFIAAPDQLKLLKLSSTGQGKAFTYVARTPILFASVNNWNWPMIPQPNYYAKALLEETLSRYKGPLEGHWTRRYILTAGNMETFLKRISQYHEMFVETRIDLKSLQRFAPILGFISHVTTNTDPHMLLSYMDLNEDAIAYSTEFDPQPFYAVMDFVVQEMTAFFEKYGHIDDPKERSRFEETRNQVRFKPKLEVRELLSDEERLATGDVFKLPRTFATGEYRQRLSMKCATGFWYEQHAVYQKSRRFECRPAPDIIGITFNEEGILGIFKYLTVLHGTSTLTVERLDEFRFVCPDRKRMEMTLTPEPRQYMRFIIAKSFQGKLANFISSIFKADQAPTLAAYVKGPHALIFMFWEMLSGHPLTSADNSFENSYRLAKFLSNLYPREAELYMGGTIMRDAYNFLCGSDDGAISVHKSLPFITQKNFDDYKVETGGVVFTDTHERFLLVIHLADVAPFLAGRGVKPILKVPNHEYVTLLTLDREIFFVLYGMIPVLVSDDEGRIVSAFPLYDHLKICCSAWQPSKEPPLWSSMALDPSKVTEERLNQDEYTSLRISGINTVIGMSVPLNRVFLEIFKKGESDNIDPDKLPKKFEERPAGSELIGVDYRFHSPEEVLAIWAPLLVSMLTDYYQDEAFLMTLFQLPSEDEPDQGDSSFSMEGLLTEITLEDHQKEEESDPEPDVDDELLAPLPMTWESFPSIAPTDWAEVSDVKEETWEEIVVPKSKAVQKTDTLRLHPPVKPPTSERRPPTIDEIKKQQLELMMMEWLFKQTKMERRTYLLTSKNVTIMKQFKEDHPEVVETYSEILPAASFTNLIPHLNADQVTVVRPQVLGRAINSKTETNPEGLKVRALRLPSIHGKGEDVYFTLENDEDILKNPYWVVLSSFDSKKRVFDTMDVSVMGKANKRISKLDWIIFRGSTMKTIVDYQGELKEQDVDVILSHKQGARFSPDFLPFKGKSKVPKPKKPKKLKSDRVKPVNPKDKRTKVDRRSDSESDSEDSSSGGEEVVVNTRGKKGRGGQRVGQGARKKKR